MNLKNQQNENVRKVLSGAFGFMLLSVLFLIPSASAEEMGMDMWNSGDLNQNESYSHTFMMETNDMYSCTPHPPDQGFPNFTGWVNVSNDTDASADNITVYIDGFAYSNRNVKIKPGVTVTWVNNDSAIHTATAMMMDDDDHDHNAMVMEEEKAPGFGLGLTFGALLLASIVATRRLR